MSSINISVQFTWTDMNKNESGYRVYKSSEPFTEETLPVVYQTLPADTQTFTDDDVPYGQTVYYMFSVFDVGGNEVFSTLSKVLGDYFIYTFSQSGDMQILSMSGKRIYRNTVSGLLGDNVSSFYYSSFANTTITMDKESNIYALLNNSTVVKFSPTFEKLWEVNVSSYVNTSYGACIKVGIFDRLFIYDFSLSNLLVLNTVDGSEIYLNTSVPRYGSRSYGLDIVPTVDKDVVFLAYGGYWSSTNRRFAAYRADIRNDTITSSVVSTTSSGYAYGKGFSDTSVESFLISRHIVTKVDYMGNVLATSSVGSTGRDLANRNTEEFFAVESNSRIYVRSKETLEHVTTDYIQHDTTINRMMPVDQDRVIVTDSNKVVMYDWKTKEALWVNDDTFSGNIEIMELSTGKAFRDIIMDEFIPAPDEDNTGS